VLIKELEKIGTLKYINKQKGIRNSKFRSDITFLLNSGIINNLNQKEIAEILVNFKTISILIEKYYSVGYELTNGLVTELDLSDIQYEVRGWKAEFKNNINRISEINGLHNLKNLKRLDLSNNRIKSLAGLENLRSINSLYLSNNQIGNPKELIHLKQLNLDYLDLYGNDISTQIEKTEFNRNLKIRINKFNF
jgi:Leucine-rich repeat (LRR) protein